MKRVSVHIDRLVLRGFERADGVAIGEAMREELARVLGDAQAVRALASSGDVPRLRATTQLDAGSHPFSVGAQVAQAIGKGLES